MIFSKLLKITTLIIFTFYCNIVLPQVSYGGKPVSWDQGLGKTKVNQLMPVNIEKPATLPDSESILPFKFAELVQINYGLDNSGQWDFLPDGSRIWRLHLKSVGAYSLNFTFSKFRLPVGAKVFVYSPDHSQLLGSFTFQNNNKNNVLPVAPIAGDEIIIEYFEPYYANFKGELFIDNVGHDYRNIFGHKDGQFGVSGDCNVDINCTEGNEWQTHKRAVCRLITNNHELCTGTLLNNTRNDQTPYLITANHCINSQYLASRTLFYFNYESPSCNGGDGSTIQSVAGAQLVATKNNDNGYLDFTLLKLNTKVPLTYRPYFAGWDARDIYPGKTVTIHHPWGDVKKISADYDNPVSATYTGYEYDLFTFWHIKEWDYGTTEGGSSGSALFNSDKRVIGTLTGGEAECGSSVNDYYQKLLVSFDKYQADTMQLKHWLDPDNSGVKVLDGYEPVINTNNITDKITIANYKATDALAYYIAGESAADGYLAGNNIYLDKAKAEYFSKTMYDNRNAITGAYILFGTAKGRPDQPVEVYIVEDNLGLPSDNIVGTSTLTMQQCTELAQVDYAYFKFDPPVITNKSVYLALKLPQYAGDTLALITTANSQNKVNTGWELNRLNQWYPYSDNNNSWGINVSHLIVLEIGRYVSVSDNKTNDNNNILNVYPNPATNNITFNIKAINPNTGVLFVYDAIGRVLYKTNSFDDNTVKINCSTWDNGFYTAVYTNGTKKSVSKIVVQH